MVVLRMDFTPMHLYDAFTQVKSDAASSLSVHRIFGLSLRLVETVEYFDCVIIRNTATCVADTDVKHGFAVIGRR